MPLVDYHRTEKIAHKITKAIYAEPSPINALVAIMVTMKMVLDELVDRPDSMDALIASIESCLQEIKNVDMTMREMERAAEPGEPIQ